VSAEPIIYVSAISRDYIKYLEKGSYKTYQLDQKSLLVHLVVLVDYIFCASDKSCKIHFALVYSSKLLSSRVFVLQVGVIQQQEEN